MMRKVTAVVMASTLILSAFSDAADSLRGEKCYLQERAALHSGRRVHMFDGIQLTKQQWQQLRDLMQQAKHDSDPVDVSEIETMHRLATAENFDEQAVRAQAEKMAQKEVALQVEIAKVRNQMYHLLTPEQQSILNEKHFQSMQQMRKLSQQHHSSLQFFGQTHSNQ